MPYISSADSLEIHLNYYSRANEAVLGEINIPQTRVKSPEATKSIFQRHGVIKSPGPAPPASEAARSPVANSRVAGCHPACCQVDTGHRTN